MDLAFRTKCTSSPQSPSPGPPAPSPRSWPGPLPPPSLAPAFTRPQSGLPDRRASHRASRTVTAQATCLSEPDTGKSANTQRMLAERLRVRAPSSSSPTPAGISASVNAQEASENQAEAGSPGEPCSEARVSGARGPEPAPGSMPCPCSLPVERARGARGPTGALRPGRLRFSGPDSAVRAPGSEAGPPCRRASPRPLGPGREWGQTPHGQGRTERQAEQPPSSPGHRPNVSHGRSPSMNGCQVSLGSSSKPTTSLPGPMGLVGAWAVESPGGRKE